MYGLLIRCVLWGVALKGLIRLQLQIVLQRLQGYLRDATLHVTSLQPSCKVHTWHSGPAPSTERVASYGWGPVSIHGLAGHISSCRSSLACRAGKACGPGNHVQEMTQHPMG